MSSKLIMFNLYLYDYPFASEITLKDTGKINDSQTMTYVTKIKLCALHIEAEAKWLSFSRRHFQIDFLEWKCQNFK